MNTLKEGELENIRRDFGRSDDSPMRIILPHLIRKDMEYLEL